MSVFLRQLISIATLICLALGSMSVAGAQDTILTIEGRTADGRQKHFTLAELEAFTRHEIRTNTPWHDGEAYFEGVLLKDLLDDVGSTGEELRVVALNDYSALLPVSDATRFNPILAYKLNGEYMRIEDKGPLFVIYPFDSDPELRAEIFHARSVWQARTIVIK